MIQAFIALLARQEKVAPRLIETHISWVILAGPFAYKIKKPVKFAFVDFTTMSKREQACREELRLNRRLAPHVYLDVVPITHHSTGEVIDWAVKMRAFDAGATLDQLQGISEHQIDAIAEVIANFHEELPAIDGQSPLGSPAQIATIVTDNLRELHGLLPGDPAIKPLDAWTHQAQAKLSGFFAERKAAGMVRECHGDLHLANIAWDCDRPLIFDGVEFSETLRSIDVINEVAFLFMDLSARRHEPLAWRMLNRYLETTGDYCGLRALVFYAVYRALVRAKISLHQNKPDDCRRYLALALRLIEPKTPRLLLMHGHSGSGKTHWSQKILQERGMMRLRSDVERQRMFSRNERYSLSATTATFDRLRNLTQALLQAGFSVIVDATFLKQPLRAMFIELAGELHLPVHIVDVAATPDECRERIRSRMAQGGDASEADLEVLEQQLATADPLTPIEKEFTMSPHTLRVPSDP